MPDLNNIISAGITVFPNPSSSYATVAVDVKNACGIKVAILDVTGKLVKEVANTNVLAGTQSFGFTTDNMPSGAYIMSVTMNGRTRAVQFTVAK